MVTGPGLVTEAPAATIHHGIAIAITALSVRSTSQRRRFIPERPKALFDDKALFAIVSPSDNRPPQRPGGTLRGRTANGQQRCRPIARAGATIPRRNAANAAPCRTREIVALGRWYRENPPDSSTRAGGGTEPEHRADRLPESRECPPSVTGRQDHPLPLARCLRSPASRSWRDRCRRAPPRTPSTFRRAPLPLPHSR